MAAAAKWAAALLQLLLAAAGMAAGAQQVDCDIMVAGTCAHPSLLISFFNFYLAIVSSISVRSFCQVRFYHYQLCRPPINWLP